MKDIFALGDSLGPAKVIHIYQPHLGLKGVLVVDNVAIGTSIGGLRMATDVSTLECARLARAMTLKNAMAGLPHGGGKSVLCADPQMDPKKKELLIRAFAHALRNETDYIFGPDMGTNEECMAWIKDEIGRSVGLPLELGGIPLDVIGATGFGVYQAIEVAMEYCNFALSGARLVVQGFGAVGSHAARFLSQKGVILVGVGDSKATIHDPNGIDVEELIRIKAGGGSVLDYPRGKKLEREALIDLDCDIWLPAARPDILHKDNIHRLKAKLVAQGANIPLTHEAEQYLHANGVLNLPDFVANAGGVICAAVEYRGGSQATAMEEIRDKISTNTRTMLEEAKRKNILPRDAALHLAQRRVMKAMALKRWGIF
ncbi:Glu/Leu/Phe/Val family dehydrogenase [Desulfobacter curvatus]|uniref:Glu/Leu/Phe/Val family dehydrogenase n=1 Tax=Desulfobacter curvatus TaxID=2290 RepID=UPI00035D43AA|nr:Glu/Leu/Phe/Val dehydrogenase [Desulfobacter curvatus]